MLNKSELQLPWIPNQITSKCGIDQIGRSLLKQQPPVFFPPVLLMLKLYDVSGGLIQQGCINNVMWIIFNWSSCYSGQSALE